MSNGTDEQMCCAAGVCCGGGDEVTALASLLRHNDGTLTENQADEAARYIHKHFTLVPESSGLAPFIRWVQDHPYLRNTHE